MSDEKQDRSIGRRTVLQTSALALGASAAVPTVSANSHNSTASGSSDNSTASGSSDDSTASGSSTDPALPNTILIEGDEDVSGFQVAVSGTIIKNTEIASVNDYTTVTGTTATGMIDAPGSDAFDYAGDITDFSLAGDAEVYVNGGEADPETLGDDTELPRAAVEATDSPKGTDGTSVKIEHVEMGVGGYLSIHDVRRRLYHEDIEENGIGSQEAISDSFIGLTDYLEPGTHHDVEIPLFDHSPWDLPGDPPQGADANRLEESQPVLAIPHIPTDPPEFQLGEDGAYTEGPRPLADLPVIHDIKTVFIEGASDEERVAAKKEEMQARQEFDG